MSSSVRDIDRPEQLDEQVVHGVGVEGRGGDSNNGEHDVHLKEILERDRNRSLGGLASDRIEN